MLKCVDYDQVARYRTKESTSQLTLLEDDEYMEGIQAIRSAVQQAAAAGEDLQLRTDLCLYATFGAAGS